MKWLLLFFLFAVGNLRSTLFYEANELAKHQRALNQGLLSLKSIAGFCAEEKAKLIMGVLYRACPDTYVEIGVYEGASILPAALVMQGLDHGKIYAIDGWSREIALKNLPSQDVRYQYWAGQNYGKHYRKFNYFLKAMAMEHAMSHLSTANRST